MDNENEGKSVEEIRAERIALSVASSEDNRPTLEEALSRSVAFIEANRGHIGGFAFTAVPNEKDALYDPETNSASEGITCKCSLNTHLDALVLGNLEEIPDRAGAKCDCESRPAMGGLDLGAMLTALRAGRR